MVASCSSNRCRTAVCFVATQAFSKALRLAQAELDQLKADVSQGKLIPQFGSKADSICNKVSPLGGPPLVSTTGRYVFQLEAYQ